MLPQEPYAAEYLPRPSWDSWGTAGCSKMVELWVTAAASCKLRGSGTGAPELSALALPLAGQLQWGRWSCNTASSPFPSLPCCSLPFSSLLRDSAEREVRRSRRAGSGEGL